MIQSRCLNYFWYALIAIQQLAYNNQCSLNYSFEKLNKKKFKEAKASSYFYHSDIFPKYNISCYDILYKYALSGFTSQQTVTVGIDLPCIFSYQDLIFSQCSLLCIKLIQVTSPRCVSFSLKNSNNYYKHHSEQALNQQLS